MFSASKKGTAEKKNKETIYTFFNHHKFRKLNTDFFIE